MRWMAWAAVAVAVAGCQEAPQGPEAPDLEFHEQGGRLSVTAAEPGLDWYDFRILLDGCQGTLHSAMVHDLPQNGRVAPHEMPLSQGDHLQFEGAGACDVDLSHAPTNSHVRSWTLQL